MKQTLLMLFATLCVLQINAQKMPTIKVGEDRLGITSLDVNVEVVGNIATTTYDMLFYNPTNQVLEGELNFPLGEGQNVSRLALEVNGKLREAVVVEKEIGRVAFEAVVRRGVDPILLEKGTGNNYKARIYPIRRKSHKRVVLAYEQELIYTEGAHYFNLPLGFKKNLDEFSLTMTVYDQLIKPELTSGTIENFAFAQMHKAYSAKYSKKNHTPGNDLTIKIPQKQNIVKSIAFEDYIYLSQTLNNKKRLREKAKKITLFWDTSFSMRKRDVQKELNLLDSYISYLGSVNIEVIKFSNEVKSKKNYKVSKDNWLTLRQDLTNSVYDGGTSYNSLFENYNADELLLFTDGMNNLSDLVMKQQLPIYVINSLIKANHTQLNQISETSNGKYINIKNKSVSEALEDLKYQAFKFLGITSTNPKLEIFPNTVQTVGSDFSIAAKNYKENDEITLRFGFGNKVTSEQVVKLTTNSTNELVKRFWAQKKLDVLQLDSDINKDQIIIHSKAYNLVSNHTSLIVLERVWDYVKYKITPPEELLASYNKIINRNKGKRVVAVALDEVNNNEDTERPQNVNVNAQVSGAITGIVTDNSGIPLPGVNVIIKGTTTGTQTNFDGRYGINASTGDVLTFSYVGLNALETTVGASNSINIAMQEDAAMLDEVVVTAQGIKREKKALGYAVSEIVAEEMEQRTEGDVARVLSGKASGVNITSQSGTSGSATNVVIRGYSSITGNNQALFVVDGVPFSNDTNSQGTFVQGNFGSSRLLDLDPNNIESVNVLKGLAAATLYGTAGRNGVIVITTKAGFGNTSSRNTRSFKKVKRKIYRGRLKLDKLKLKTPYLNELSNAKNAKDAYSIYLKQRDKYQNLPAYFIDVFDFFQTFKREKYSNMILSNIAEIDFDNYELLRVYAYKLEAIKNHGLAAFIYSKVLELRPEDAQSYRDLALVYQETGMNQEAFNLLNSIVSDEVYNKQGRRKFAGMKSITKNEINNLLQNRAEVNSDKLDNTMRINTEFDVRIVIDWNHNDTDIDLHIIDPFLEECSYKNRKTQIGGELTKDMTKGFGPEEFTLRNAKKGEYFIKVNYYGDRYQKIESPTFMKVTVFRNYGKTNETKEIKVVRLTKRKDDLMVSKLTI